MKKSPLKAKTSLKAKTGLVSNQKPLQKTAVKPTKSKLPTISKLKREADKYYSQAVRYRFSYIKNGERLVDCTTCEVFKPLKMMQNGHFMSRQYNATRYHDQNTGPQCYGCNVMHQGRQYEFGMALDALYGPGTAKSMHDLAKTPHQFKREELLDIISKAKEEIAFYEQD